MRVKSTIKTALSFLLVLTMMLQYAPMAAFAAEDSFCEHHPAHTAACAYVEGESACTFHCGECLDREEPAVELTQAPVCYCAERCTEDAANEYCDVCAADHTACTGEDAAASYTGVHTHPVCGSSCSSEHDSVDWLPLTTTDMVLESGYYFLDHNITLQDYEDCFEITGDVAICLNGYKISKAVDIACISVKSTGNLTICDCAGGGSVYHAKRQGNSSSENALYLGGSMTLYGGTIQSDGFDGIMCSTNGDLTIRGGQVIGNYCGIRVHDLNDLTISGGTITGKNRPAVEFSHSTFRNITVSGGILSGAEGGLVFSDRFNCSGKVTISGGTLNGVGPVPNATTYAGHYYGLSFMSNYDTNNANVYITGGTLKGARGGVYNHTPATINISGGVIGTAGLNTHGLEAAAHVSAGTLNVNGGTLYGLYSEESAKVTVNSGSILQISHYPTSGWLKVYGGTVGQAGGSTATTALSIGYFNASETGGSTWLYGGTFVGTEDAVSTSPAYPLHISGGTYNGGIADLHLNQLSESVATAPVSLSGYTGAPLTVTFNTYNAADNYFIAKNVGRDGLITLTQDGYAAKYDASKSAVKLHIHSYGTLNPEVPATCTETGTLAHKNCSGCDLHFDAQNKQIDDLTIAALGHEYNEEEVCIRCGVAMIKTSGKCGENLYWAYDGEGTIIISGTGPMDSYNLNTKLRPWDIYADEITTVIVGEGVTTIGSSAFISCSKLQFVSLPETLTKIFDNGFSFCSSLQEIRLPDGLQFIDGYAFYRDNLTSIHLGPAVSKIGTQNPFEENFGLTQITVDPENPYFCAVDNVLFTKDMKTLLCYPAGLSQESYTVPEGVVSIGRSGFSGNNMIQTVVLPETVTTLGYSAFHSCDSLSRLDMPCVEHIGSLALSFTSLHNIVFPATVKSIDYLAISQFQEVETMFFTGDAPEIHSGAFGDNVDKETTVYYPADNATWTADKLQGYGRIITWIPYCVGEHIYENGLCKNCGDQYLCITRQPEDTEMELGKKFAITVQAQGEGLTYQWYYKDNGMKQFKPSSNKTSSYAYTMQSYMHNRQVYCVVTDRYGNQTTSDTATITRPPMALAITQQPQDVRVNVGEKFSIKPTVQGEGLTYQWYVKDAGAKAFKVSSNKTSAYAYTMAKYMVGRQVYCVITDKQGNSVTTDVATILLPAVELKLLSQPEDVYAVKGEKFSVDFDIQGDGLTYQWFYKERYQKNFSASSNKSSAYAYSMQSYMDGRSVYCVITDEYGNQVTTDVVTIHLEQ